MFSVGQIDGCSSVPQQRGGYYLPEHQLPSSLWQLDGASSSGPLLAAIATIEESLRMCKAGGRSK